MAKIILINGMAANIDDDLFTELSSFKWYAKKDKNTYYAVTRINGKLISMHRLIMQADKRNTMIDHEDGNGLNNVRSNLRDCNFSQNNANRKKTKGTSKYLGVCKTHGKWQAATRKDGKLTVAGYFDIEIEAALAYNKLALEQHGKFAKLNII